MGDSHPNVLLVVMDTARADVFEPYGAPSGSTPTAAQLARSGRARGSVFATANWTLPSHASMFSGCMPRAIGLGQAPGGTYLGARPVLESLEPLLLPAVLQASGYRTAGVSTNMWITEHSGFATGFDRFESVHAGRNDHIGDRRLRHRIGWDVEAVFARRDDGASQVRRLLDRWAGAVDGRPFFWFVNLTECHSPCLPPRPYNDMSFMGRLRAGEEANLHLNLVSIWRACLGKLEVPVEAIERMRHLYRRSILYMDDWLSGVLELLDQRRLLDDTMVVVTSDHGENFGEGDLIGHAFSLDDRLIRVPLICSDADLFPGEAPVSLRDLPAAIAERVGLSQHPWKRRGGFGDAAVAEIEALVGPEDPRAQEATKGWGLDEEGLRRLTGSGWCATDGNFKLLHLDGDEVVYDLVADPLEEKPVALWDAAPDQQAAADRLRRAGVVETNEPPQALEQARNSGEELPGPSPHEMEEIAARMRRLGYV